MVLVVLLLFAETKQSLFVAVTAVALATFQHKHKSGKLLNTSPPKRIKKYDTSPCLAAHHAAPLLCRPLLHSHATRLPTCGRPPDRTRVLPNIAPVSAPGRLAAPTLSSHHPHRSRRNHHRSSSCCCSCAAAVAAAAAKASPCHRGSNNNNKQSYAARFGFTALCGRQTCRPRGSKRHAGRTTRIRNNATSDTARKYVARFTLCTPPRHHQQQRRPQWQEHMIQPKPQQQIPTPPPPQRNRNNSGNKIQRQQQQQRQQQRKPTQRNDEKDE
jgi:hypothetical protein